jgi:soluble lytic murein transglycosylase
MDPLNMPGPGGRKGGDIHRMRTFGKATLAALTLAFASLPAAALPSAPSIKPRAQQTSPHLEAAQFRALDRALDAAEEGRWGDFRAQAAQVTDPAGQALLRWRQAMDGNSGLGFQTLSAALEEFAGWPDTDRIVEQAETTIINSALTADERIAWLKARGPRTPRGHIALADAYLSQARPDEAKATIQQLWRTRALPDDLSSYVASAFGGMLTPDDHWARVDMLLWRGDLREAASHYHRITPGQQRLAQARAALRRNENGVDALVDSVPPELAGDPGLAFERARWRERRGREDGELEMLLRVRGTDAAPIGRDAIWEEKHSVVYRLIRVGDFQTAYTLADGHGLTSGDGFREAEWLAGWLALEKLRDAAKAEAHFRTFAAGVATPISISRGQYWLGRALESQGRAPEALAAYEEAAKYPYVFYGQLAAEKVGATRPEARRISFAAITPPTAEERASFEARPAVRAAILLAETGRLASFERFSNAIDDTLATPAEHQMLYDIGKRYLEMRAALRGAKAGLQRGIVAPDAVFPVLSLPRSTRSGAAEDAMVLALSRQESEFNPRAISVADARGLMQLVPRYAQDEARKVGVPYRTSWLTDDPNYNLRLGRGFLDELVQRYNGSYLLAAAAYNAGPSRVSQWMAAFGDPREGGGADPIDWIESIPFEETRNYVQRVLENTQVYRHRLAGEPVDIQLSRDLRRGRPRY